MGFAARRSALRKTLSAEARVNPRNFFAELKRRTVICMAGPYPVGAWLMTHVASIVLPAFDVPSWTLRGLITRLVLSLIPALIFSWVLLVANARLRVAVAQHQIDHGATMR